MDVLTSSVPAGRSATRTPAGFYNGHGALRSNPTVPKAAGGGRNDTERGSQALKTLGNRGFRDAFGRFRR